MIEQNMAQMENRVGKDHMTYCLMIDTIVSHRQLIVSDYILDGPLIDLQMRLNQQEKGVDRCHIGRGLPRRRLALSALMEDVAGASAQSRPNQQG